MLREYRVTLNGTETTAMLTEADADRLGGVLVAADEPAADEPAADEPATATAKRAPTKARTVRNKSRR